LSLMCYPLILLNVRSNQTKKLATIKYHHSWCARYEKELLDFI
jgi:hypothetical protein